MYTLLMTLIPVSRFDVSIIVGRISSVNDYFYEFYEEAHYFLSEA